LGEPISLRTPTDLAREMPKTSRPARARGGVGTRLQEGFAHAQRDREALLVLLSLPSLTPRRLLELSAEHGVASRCLEAVRGGAFASSADRRRAATMTGSDVAEQVKGAGARFLTTDDPEYPKAMFDLFDPPAGLFVKGAKLGELEPRVAIVGARNCSAPGAEIAHLLGRDLALAGVCVVSGAARGIDAAAHRGALESAGRTMAVLGCGIDIAYPAQNRGLLEQVSGSGAVLSEYPPGTPAEPFRFPARNRIVAALSMAVVVVEGALGSGSMITADHALEIGRDVFAVPGSVSSELAQVPLLLIRDGAGLVRGAEDLLSDLGLIALAPAGHGSTERPAVGELGALTGASANERSVWEALRSASPADALTAATGLSLPEVMSALLGLELRRLVLRVGGRYERRPGKEWC